MLFGDLSPTLALLPPTSAGIAGSMNRRSPEAGAGAGRDAAHHVGKGRLKFSVPAS